MNSNKDGLISIQKALARNRILHDVLREGYQPQHDTVLREMGLTEMRRSVATRRSTAWRFSAAAALTAAAFLCLAFLQDSTTRVKPETLATGIQEKKVLSPERAREVFVTQSPGFEIARVSHSERLLQTIPSRDALAVTSAPQRLTLSPSVFTCVSSALADAHLETVTTSATRQKPTRIADSEILCLPRVVAILGEHDGTKRLVIASVQRR